MAADDGGRSRRSTGATWLEARALCEQMKHEWRYLHDLMVEGIGGLISFVQERLGDDGVADAWTNGQGRGWRRDVEKIAARDRKEIVHALAATWRAHSVPAVPDRTPGRSRSPRTTRSSRSR